MLNKKYLITGLSAALLAVLFGQAPVGAVSNVGPDPNDFEAGNQVHMEVTSPGKGNTLDAPDSIVTLYFKKSRGNYVNIRHMDHCRYSPEGRAPANAKDTILVPNPWPDMNRPGKGNMRITVKSGGSQVATVRNTVWLNRQNLCENVNYKLQLGALEPSQQAGLEGYYEAKLRAHIVEPYPGAATGTTNAFKVSVPRGAGCNYNNSPRQCNYVSFSPDAGDQFVLQQRGYNNRGEFTRFDIKFGTSCDITSAQRATLRWFDDDQGNNSAQQRTISFQVLEKPYGAPDSAFRPLPLQGDGRYVPPPGGAGKSRSTKITVKPNHVYIWRWRNVQTENGVQFQIPFEAIFYQTGCALYQLRPQTSVSQDTVVQGQNVTFGHWVFNEGPTKSPRVDWQVRGRTIPGGASVRPAEANVGNPNNRGGVKNSGSTVYERGSRRANNGSAAGRFRQTVTITAEPGQKVCRSLGVSPAGNGVNNRWSAERCVLVAKRPTVHFIGGDVAVGRPFCSASGATTDGGIYTVANGTNNGSAVEYAAFVEGIIEFNRSLGLGFGTGSRTGTTESRVGQLGFANTNEPVGNFGSGGCMTDFYREQRSSIRPIQASPGAVNLSGFSGEVQRNFNGNLQITPSNIQNGARILLVVNGNVTITGDIRYSGNYASTGDIPSLAVIANGDITIDGNVGQLDGVYVSKDTVHTCDNRSGPLTNRTCSQQLVVNGAIVTQKLNLRRTFGAAGNSKTRPAELFNYTTELFFNNVLAGPDNTIETMLQRDLPPRY